MVKVVAFREKSWLDKITDYRMWDHLCRAYDVQLQMVDDWSEIDFPSDYTVIAADEEGSPDLETFVEAYSDLENMMFIFGRTHQKILVDLRRLDVTYMSVRINTPNNICLFGVVAAGIILDRVVN